MQGRVSYFTKYRKGKSGDEQKEKHTNLIQPFFFFYQINMDGEVAQ